MHQPQKKLSEVNWINWAELVERVRTAKNPDVAVSRLQKDIDLAWKLYSAKHAEDTLTNYSEPRKALLLGICHRRLLSKVQTCDRARIGPL